MRWTYQNIRTCATVSLMSSTHTKFTRSAKKTAPSRKRSCLKKQKDGTSQLLYIPAIANRLLTILKCECSAHSWWNPGLCLLLHRALWLCHMRLFQNNSNKWIYRNTDIFVTQGFLSANCCRLNWLSVHLAGHFFNYEPSQILRLT